MDNECIGERIHDADPDVNERMVHWVHSFFKGECTLEEVKKTFNTAYNDQDFINFPWE